eukprot:s2192_g5.t1
MLTLMPLVGWCGLEQGGHIDAARQLLQAGARVNAARLDGATPLLFASQNGHKQVVRLLLAANADAKKARTTDGATAIARAHQKGHVEIVKVLEVFQLFKDAAGC